MIFLLNFIGLVFSQKSFSFKLIFKAGYKPVEKEMFRSDFLCLFIDYSALNANKKNSNASLRLFKRLIGSKFL